MMKELLIVNAGNTHIETLLVPDPELFVQKGHPGCGEKKIFTREEFAEQGKALLEGRRIAAASASSGDCPMALNR